MKQRHLLFVIFLAWSTASGSSIRVFLRWDLKTAPPPGLPGVAGLAVPWYQGNDLMESVTEAGYRVYYLISPGDVGGTVAALGHRRLSGILIGSEDLREAMKAELQARWQVPASIEVSVAWQTGHFPGILSNSVQKKDGVLQIAAASSQPWIESNQAAAEILKQVHPGNSFLYYSWPEDVGQPASVENYLLAIAEAGACGTDLILPLGREFQESLVLRKPDAERQWRQIAAYIEAYSRHQPRDYRRPDNVVVVAEDFENWHELLKLLSRYNVPFQLVPRRGLTDCPASTPRGLVLFLAVPDSSEIKRLEDLLNRGFSAFVTLEAKGRLHWSKKPSALQESDDSASYRLGKGRVVELYGSGIDPNALALDVRRILGNERRPIQLWNALTVLASLYREESGVLLYLTNYALSPQLVQARVAGRFSKIECIRPEEGKVEELSFERDNDFTGFTVPGVKIGTIVYLRR
ncbi:MAG: hypothetical protein EHM61_12950 [Acidobacteria bacterium]|nr:MAG: hypothetical protein EHM61_12950 [Acidobacteriota bacterium]